MCAGRKISASFLLISRSSLEPAAVELHVVGAPVEQPPEPGERVHHEVGVTRDQLAEVARRLRGHLLDRAAFALGERGELLLEAAAAGDLLDHELRHLVADADDRHLGALERQQRLAIDERRELVRVDVAAGALGPALAQLAGRRRGASQQPAAVRHPPQDVDLAVGVRAARVVQRDEVEQVRQPRLAADARDPRDLDRDDQRVVAARQPFGQARVVDLEALDRLGRQAGRRRRRLPLGDQLALDHGRGILEHDHAVRDRLAVGHKRRCWHKPSVDRPRHGPARQPLQAVCDGHHAGGVSRTAASSWNQPARLLSA